MEKISEKLLKYIVDDFEGYTHYLMGVPKEVKAMASELLELREQARWIPVGERLPEDDKDIDILWQYDIDPGTLRHGNTVKFQDEKRIYAGDGDLAKTVVYWKYSMPLPPAPERGE